MSGGRFHQYHMPVRLNAGTLVVVSMACFLLRVCGLGVAHPCQVQLGHRGSYTTSVARACLWEKSRRSVSRSSNNNDPRLRRILSRRVPAGTEPRRIRAWTVGAPMHMTSELSKTAISRMRVADLRKELAKRGLEDTGLRPVLQARLGGAAEAERSRGAARPTPHRPSSSRSAVAGARAVADTFPRSATQDMSYSQRTREGRAPSTSKRAMSMGSSTPSPSQSFTHVMQFDGGSRGNPGPSGAGAVLYRQDASGARVEVWSGSVWIGADATNNQAEYLGLIEGLNAAERMGIKRLAVEGDSKLVIQQMRGKYKVLSPRIKPLYNKAKLVANSFDELDMEHIKRELNGRADTLANAAMDTRTTTLSPFADT